MDPNTCKHDEVAVEANTNRVTLENGETGAMILSIKARCAKCGARFWFPGAPTGVSYAEPTTTSDGFTLTVPLVRQNLRHRPDPSLVGFALRGGDLAKGYVR